MNSIKKGKSFEREIANKLTEILGIKFMRVPMSGAFSTSFKTKDSRFDGDIFTEDEEYKDIIIECKSHNYMATTDFFNIDGKFYSFIEQVESESKNNPWILFIKINNIGTFVVFDEDFFNKDRRKNYLKIYHRLLLECKYLGIISLKDKYTVFII
jgi:Holliday junction resolvase